jgi:DNA-binding HxlR family transcriptional regulator
MKPSRRSGCPISFSLEILGDRWSLLVLRDIVFRSARYFQDFFESGEGIASNVLAGRLRHLEACGIITKTRDPEDGRRYRYTLTSVGLDLIPLLVDLALWGTRHHPERTSPPLGLDLMARDREEAIQYYRELAV